MHAVDLASRLAPGGRFLFSGIPAERAPATLDAIAAAQLQVQASRQRGRWCTYTGTKTP